ncbi:hypothetical protein [Staphylococcus sp. 11261D007BR]
MEKYNRDLYSKGLESYEVPQYENQKRLDFVFGFVTGAVLGSALGIILNTSSKSSKVTINPKEKKMQYNTTSPQIREEAERKANAIKEQARNVAINHSEDNQTQEEPTASEISAQKRAIQSEVDSDRLEGQTKYEQPDNTDVSASRLAEAANDKNESLQKEQSSSKEEVSESSLAAQRRAIQSEVDSDRLEGQKGTEKSTDDKASKEEVSESSLAAQRRAIQSEVDSDRLEGQKGSTKNDSRQNEAQFDKGVITHDKKDEKTSSNNTKTTAKKTTSKVEKKKFNQ